MITHRTIEEKDYELLANSLQQDEYHQGTGIDFFKEPMTTTSLYFFDDEPILFVRGKGILAGTTAAIQLDIQFLDNNNKAKNMITMLTGYYELERKARAEGFCGFLFNSTVPLLRKFCVRRLGFQEWDDQLLVKVLQEVPVDTGPGVML